MATREHLNRLHNLKSISDTVNQIQRFFDEILCMYAIWTTSMSHLPVKKLYFFVFNVNALFNVARKCTVEHVSPIEW